MFTIELSCTHLEHFSTTAVTGAVAGGGGKDDPESKCEFDMADLRITIAIHARW
jgi:hypothetical protein